MPLFRKSAIAVSVFVLFSSLFLPGVIAQNAEDGSGNGLLVSPTRSEISAQPGEQKSFSITLRNVTSNDIVAQASLNDFESDNVSGTPQIIVDSRERTPNTLENMLKGLNDVELKAGELKEIKLSLDIPSNITPGAYFGAVRYAGIPKNTPEQPDRQVSLTASVAHLVFLEVAGDVNQQIQIDSVKAQKNGKSASFFFQAPNGSAVSIKNLGNGFARPFGTITVKNFFGKEVYNYKLNETDPRGIVLPNSSRTFSDKIENVKTPGRYTITAPVAYGNGGEVAVYTGTFWYLPAWFLLLVLVILGAVGIGGYYFYKRRFGSTVSKRKKISNK